MRKIVIFFICLLSCLIIATGCHKKNNANKKKQGADKKFTTIVVKSTPLKSTLYFSGTLKAAKQLAIVSPVDGIVIKQNFHYGEYIKKNQLLFGIKSTKKQSNYQQTLIKYLKAKQTSTLSTRKFKNNQNLWKKGLISHDDFIDSKNTYLLDRLSFMQAKAQLTLAIGKQPKLKKIENLTLKNISTVIKQLNLEKTFQNINIYSPGNGIALYNKQARAKIGTAVKKDKILLYLAKAATFTTDIDINEINVNQLHVGQPATITGVAFPNFTLKGYIEAISAQALSDTSLPTFSAKIAIPRLTKSEQKLIKIGMSVKIAITVKHKPHIMIPIQAIDIQTNTVQILVKNKRKSVPVQTGETTFNDVVILSGLKAGDKIVVPNKTN